MASFSRSFKPHSYLSPIRRPNMPGRSMSNSSLQSEDGERTSSEHTSPAQSPKVRPNHFGSHMSEPKPYTGCKYILLLIIPLSSSPTGLCPVPMFVIVIAPKWVACWTCPGISRLNRQPWILWKAWIGLRLAGPKPG